MRYKTVAHVEPSRKRGSPRSTSCREGEAGTEKAVCTPYNGNNCKRKPITVSGEKSR